jgi:hypothetical protein
VARILNPICITLDRIDELAKNAGIRELIESKFDSLDLCKKTILGKQTFFCRQMQ